ncbi:MAG TPA: hypothetical protein VND90_14250 [Terracidiphilus sp.]|nr:hypothetical protein [Terracidiphilus sp.]
MRQETYCFAFEEAEAELRDIMVQYEQLRSRKEQVEKVVAALQPFLALSGGAITEQAAAEETHFAFLGAETGTAVAAQPEMTPELQAFLLQEGLAEEVKSVPIHLSMTAETELEPEDEPVPEMSADPFQRRIDDVLRHGIGGRELRIHSRSLNGLLSRA